MDIRKVGSGTSGAANVWENISRRWGIVVALIDAAKGFLAIFIARQVGAEPDVQWGTGLAAIIGHNWSVFMKFGGGRGLATVSGVLLLLAPLQLAIMLAMGTIITLLSSTPLGTLLSIRPRRVTPYLAILSSTTLGALAAISSLPLASLWLGKSTVVIWASLAIFLLLIFKRLIPGHSMLSSAKNRRQVFLYRLLLDRDIIDREAWVHRSPGTTENL